MGVGGLTIVTGGGGEIPVITTITVFMYALKASVICSTISDSLTLIWQMQLLISGSS